MNRLLDIQKKLLPELVDTMGMRYRILRFVRLMQPIGRRNLAASLEMSERVLRSEVMFLKDQGLLNVATSGMTLTEEGHNLLVQLEEVMKETFDLSTMEKQLASLFQLKQVVIVPGDSDDFPWVKKEMGRACVSFMKKNLSESDVIAVTGGTSISAVAEMMVPDAGFREALFVPARGGLGEQVENQANTICAEMAQRASGRYRLLHVPDQLGQGSYKSLIEEPSVREILSLIRSATMVVHGIGEAETMAERRQSPADVIDKLQRKKAAAEAFGYYFDHSGDIIHKVLTIGLQMEDLAALPNVIAVAGGSSKGDAIRAYMKQGPSEVLVTDEGAAKTILGKADKA
ncbi:sugar-binding transcriptional regulator [Alteribacter natronophilus]|uniref:sugar-binding transcriptional regulator n=1 Tax=Alteribacter natronophilus TaxID=2583810 RepID=UPI00110E33E9|nr:sugar-binding domain-containing protein [Alteribacter natronophilus]TMW72427.1 hypothetical protein FGB90_09520 [Alteribacter natronophilus]